MICESEMLPREYVCRRLARSDAWRESRMGREGGVEDWLVNSLSVSRLESKRDRGKKGGRGVSKSKLMAD